MDSGISDFLQNNSSFIEQDTIQHEAPTLTWINVAIASLFILVNGGISVLLGLQLEKSLIIAAIRCLVQLTIMGYILEDVFKASNPYLVLLMSFVLILLGAYETVYNKSKQTYNGMFISVLVSSGVSTLVIGIVGTQWAMRQRPFWIPEIFIPTMGMLLGNAMSGMAVALSSCLSSVSSRKEQIETYLAFGASRWEAGQAIAIEAVRLAMLPTINQMSVIGLISIPGMMTGQILGGASVDSAVKYQQIIMFLISASTALGVLSVVVSCVRVMIDSKHRLRPERILNGRASLFRDIRDVLKSAWASFVYVLCCFYCFRKKRQEKQQRIDDEDDDDLPDEQSRPLLSNSA
ncbi:hypothetical protein K501DRAFT_236681 [Backusella circina FSU 941]|nr:hypothetical protein K501DRAFT_236681 [Backusella circina FSU 941]